MFYVAQDHYSETAWRNTVPTQEALDAARHFAHTGELAATVRWEEV
ncbi:MAG: hypothetical protein JWQ20_3347 [Conexibacter sp.]|nr:hypothetical protein [Conexibacter sp.]